MSIDLLKIFYSALSRICIPRRAVTDKQIELLRLISSADSVLKREIKQVSILKKLVEYGRVAEFKVEKRRLEIPDFEFRKNC